MNRRNAISSIVLLSLGAVVLPSCEEHKEAVLKLKNLSLDGSEEKLLHQLAESIIPKTNFIGASNLNAPEFILQMVDDCYSPEQQQQFMKGLKEFDKLARSKYGSSFTSIPLTQKNEWLNIMEKKQELSDEVLFFYETSRNRTVQAFTSSKEYLTDVLKYNMVPGSNFKGCVAVKKT